MSEIMELREDGPAEYGSVTRTRRVGVAWRAVVAVTGIAVVVHAAVLTRYGWFGDEFYYVICGRHPAWG